jgi:hypothetical protein
MQQLPELRAARPCATTHSSASAQSTATIVVGVLYIPVSDVTAVTHDSILVRNGWSGNSGLHFEASPEDDAGCCCRGLMLDMSGRVMHRASAPGCSSAALQAVSSSWQPAEHARVVTVQDVVHVTYTPQHPAHASCLTFGGWGGGRAEVRVEGEGGGFSCSGEVPEGHVAGRWHVTYV